MNRKWIIASICLLLVSCHGEKPKDLGAVDNQLKDCPDKPNCVSTKSTDERHAILPIEFKDAPEKVIEKVAAVVKEMSGGKVIEQNTNYLHAEFTSTLLRFKDDVEFLVDANAKTLHFRSASRLGHSDLGANRKRMEQFRIRFFQK